MGKISRTKKQNQGHQVHLVQKISSGQIQVSIKKTEIGKPAGLSKIKLEQPDIWSTQQQDIDFLTFLINEGRHLILHSAGAKKNIKSEKDQHVKQIKEEKYNHRKSNQPLFDFLETFSQSYLGLPQNIKKKERIIVFFFRNNCLPYKKQEYKRNSELKQKPWYKILKNTYFLLDKTFFEELIDILEILDKQNNLDEIVNDLIVDFCKCNNLNQIKVIFKNLLIQIFKYRTDINLNWDIVQNYSPDYIFSIYKNRINEHKDQIKKFIENINNIFNGKSTNNVQYQEIEKQDYVENSNPQLSPIYNYISEYSDDYGY